MSDVPYLAHPTTGMIGQEIKLKRSKSEAKETVIVHVRKDKKSLGVAQINNGVGIQAIDIYQI